MATSTAAIQDSALDAELDKPVRKDTPHRANQRSFPHRGGRSGRGTFSHRYSPIKSQKQKAPATKISTSVTFEKKSTPLGMMSSSRKTLYPVYSSNLGLDSVVESVYNSMTARDHRLAHRISLNMMKYITSCAWLNRVTQCAIHYGYAYPIGVSDLKKATAGIILPEMLAKYIESFGLYQGLNGLKIVPHCWNDFAGFFGYGPNIMVNPDVYLELDHRPIPPNLWHLDNEWIVAYNEAISRAAQRGFSFRRVTQDVYQGSSAMVSSFSIENDYIVAWSTETTIDAELRLSGCFKYRRSDLQDAWPGENSHLIYAEFRTMAYDPRIELSDLILDQIVPDTSGLITH